MLERVLGYSGRAIPLISSLDMIDYLRENFSVSAIGVIYFHSNEINFLFEKADNDRLCIVAEGTYGESTKIVSNPIGLCNQDDELRVHLSLKMFLQEREDELMRKKFTLRIFNGNTEVSQSIVETMSLACLRWKELLISNAEVTHAILVDNLSLKGYPLDQNYFKDVSMMDADNILAGG